MKLEDFDTKPLSAHKLHFIEPQSNFDKQNLLGKVLFPE